MSDYINECGHHFIVENELKTHLDFVKQLPAAPVREVVRGEWKLNRDGSGTCSVCHFTQSNVWDLDRRQNYCGHCGADMREES